VTVVTPTYNGSRYLRETIESIQAQDYPNVEHIVLDDGSTDETSQVLAEFAGALRVERHENMGQVLTVNRGFSLAAGEIVVVVCDDDPLLPGVISAGVEALERRPDLVVAYPDWNLIDEHGDVVEVIRTWDYSYTRMLREHYCVPGPAAFIRRRLIDRIGGRDPQFRYVHDFEFWLRAGLVGPFGRIPEVLATFRVHSAQLSAQEGPAMAAEHIAMIEKLYAQPDLPSDVRRARRQAFSSAYYIAGAVSGKAPAARIRYSARAIAWSPHLYLWRYRARTLGLLRGLLGTTRARLGRRLPVRRPR
jgi:glycosyltransferase involved in cell wall biosynthesis